MVNLWFFSYALDTIGEFAGYANARNREMYATWFSVNAT